MNGSKSPTPRVTLDAKLDEASVTLKELCGGKTDHSYVQKPVDFAQFRDTVKNAGLYWLMINQPALQD